MDYYPQQPAIIEEAPVFVTSKRLIDDKLYTDLKNDNAKKTKIIEEKTQEANQLCERLYFKIQMSFFIGFISGSFSTIIILCVIYYFMGGF